MECKLDRQELKLKVIKLHEENEKIVAHTVRKFEVDRKRTREWLKRTE